MKKILRSASLDPDEKATSSEVIIAPMDGRANQWGVTQPVDLKGNRKSHFSVSASKKS